MSCGFQLSGAVTVDRMTPDRFLDLTRARYGAIAKDRLFPHSDRAGAISLCMSTRGEANIVGHGRVGVICTGCNDFENPSPLLRIKAFDIGNWGPSRMTMLTLLGCNTGEGEAGADLLFQIANVTRATVRAPTCYVYIGSGCDDYTLETPNCWQTSGPDVRPTPIFDPVPEFFLPTELQFRSGAIWVKAGVTSVTRIALYDPGPIDGKPPLGAVTRGEEILEAISRVDFNEPMLRGAPAAMETGRLTVDLNTDNIEPRRTFRILNDNRLQDLTYPEVLYRANIRALRELMRRLR